MTVKDLIDYDPETGALTWRERPPSMFSCSRLQKRWNTRYAGKPALSSVGPDKYLRGCFLGKHKKAHRAAWEIYYGYSPVGVDHINGDTSDNRISNLREADQALNSKNRKLPSSNTSGIHGVFWVKGRSLWAAAIARKTIGYYKSKDEAALARKTMEIELGYHENHGRLT